MSARAATSVATSTDSEGEHLKPLGRLLQRRRRRARRWRGVIGVAACVSMAAAASACGSASSAASGTGQSGSSTGSGSAAAATKSLTPITVGCDNSFFGCLPFFVANAEGFWTKNGLKVTYVTTTNTQATAASLASGSIDIGLGPDAFTLATKYKTPVKYVSGLNGQFFEIVAQSSVHGCSGTPAQRLKALKGQKIGVSGIDSEAYYEVLDGLKTVGLGASNVTFVNIQGLLSPELAALKSHSISALMTDPVGAAELSSNGVCVVANYATPGYLPAAQQQIVQGMEAKTSWIASHGAAVTGFQKALAEAITWMKKPANFSKAESLMKSDIGSNFNSSILKSITTDEVSNIAKGYEDVASIKAVYKSDLALGTISAIPNVSYSSYLAPGTPTTPSAVATLAGATS